MKPSSSASRKPSSVTQSAPSSHALTMPALPSLPKLMPETFPHFPTVAAILEHQAGRAVHPLVQLSDSMPRMTTSLFQGLLGGRVEVLVQDALDNPERYDEATRTALAELASHKGALTQEQQAMLDNAVLDFAAARPPARTPPVLQRQAPPPRGRRSLDDGAMGDSRVPQVETPAGPMPAYWWIG